MDDAGDLLGGFDRRLTRQEEWSKLDDGRMDRLEIKLDKLGGEMADFRAEIRANMVTRADLKEERRHSETVTWTAVGVIVAAMALVATLFQTLQSSSPRMAPPPAVIVQVPGAPPSARAGGGSIGAPPG